MGVDNAIIEMDANEPPIGDGSAQPYVELIKKAGSFAQEAPRRFFDVREPIISNRKTGSHPRASCPMTSSAFPARRPARTNRFTQFLSTEITPAIFEREIAPARTFVFYEDVQPLMEKNLIKGGSLENAIVVRGEAVLSKEPLRFPDEFVRHKILDIIGDLALVGQRIRGHVIAVKPGHGQCGAGARDRERDGRRPRLRSATFPPGEGGLDINEVMEILPHRYPFLMVDRIVGFRRRNEITGVKSCRSTSRFFRDIFPGIR